jgi:HEAT repeat protein
MFQFGQPNIEKLTAKRNVRALTKALGYRKAWYTRKAAAEALGKLGDVRAIEPLTIALKDEDKDVRRTAADALEALHWQPHKDEASAYYWISKKNIAPCAEIGEPAVFPLIRVLAERDPDDCRAAAEALGRIGDPRAVEPLIGVVRESGWGFIGSTAAEALSRMGSEGAEQLLGLLADPSTDVRLTAVRALGGLGDPQAVEPLHRALSDADRDVRQAAAVALGKLGGAAVGALIDALQDKAVAAHAIQALAAIGDVRALPPLIAALRDESYGVRVAAVDAIGSFGGMALDPLIDALRVPNRNARRAAAETLDKLGWQPGADATGTDYWIAKQNWDRCVANKDAAVAPLAAMLHDPDAETRKACAVCLGKIGDRRAFDPLVAGLQDEDPAVRETSAESLGRMGDSRAIDPLLVALKDPDWTVRDAAAKGLGRFAEERTMGALIDALRDPAGHVREEAAEALGRIGHIRAVEPLIRALGDEHEDTRRFAAEALGRIGDPRAVEPLIGALEWDYYQLFEAALARQKLTDTRSEKEIIDELVEKYVFIREAAAKALGRIGDARAVDALIAALKYISRNVREAAAEALGRIGDARAVEPLIEALKDREVDVHESAAEALVRLGASAVAPLIDLLKQEKNGPLLPAVEVLGKIGDAHAVEPLIGALKNESEKVREAAAIALVRIGSPAIDPLVNTLKFENKAVRTAAIAILTKLDWKPEKDEAGAYYWIVKRQWNECVDIGSAAVDPLITALKDQEALRSDEWQERQAAVRALGRIGKPATGPLISALKFEDEDVCKAAVDALGQIGEPAVQPLIDALSDEYYGVCMAAAEALGKIGDPRAVEPLIAALKNGGWYMIRKAAAEALGRIGDPRAVEPLIAVLKDEYFKVREAGTEALIKIGAPAVEPLIAALQYREWRMRKAATEVLGKIGDARAVEPLIAALEDEDKDVRKSVAWGLISLSNIAPLDDDVKQRILSVIPIGSK